MSGSKLDLMKKRPHFVVTQLTTWTDWVSSITGENKFDIDEKIDSVQTRGSTNLTAVCCRECRSDEASILLLTDRLANVDISNTEEIIAAMKDPFPHQVATGRSQPVPCFSQEIVNPLIIKQKNKIMTSFGRGEEESWWMPVWRGKTTINGTEADYAELCH